MSDQNRVKRGGAGKISRHQEVNDLSLFSLLRGEAVSFNKLPIYISHEFYMFCILGAMYFL